MTHGGRNAKTRICQKPKRTKNEQAGLTLTPTATRHTSRMSPANLPVARICCCDHEHMPFVHHVCLQVGRAEEAHHHGMSQRCGRCATCPFHHTAARVSFSLRVTQTQIRRSKLGRQAGALIVKYGASAHTLPPSPPFPSLTGDSFPVAPSSLSTPKRGREHGVTPPASDVKPVLLPG